MLQITATLAKWLPCLELQDGFKVMLEV